MDLSEFPPIFILPTHLQTDELHEAEDHLCQLGGKLTYEASEARIFLGRLSHQKRATFDLRARGIWTQEVAVLPTKENATRKRRRGDDASSPLTLSDTEPETETVTQQDDDIDDGLPVTMVTGQKRKRSDEIDQALPDLSDHVMVLKLKWLEDCTDQNLILPYNPYLVYTGKIVPKPVSEPSITPTKDKIIYIKATPDSTERLLQTSTPTSLSTRAKYVQSGSGVEPTSSAVSGHSKTPFHRRKFGQNSFGQSQHNHPRPKLHRTTTSEFEEAAHTTLPPEPGWLSEPHPRPLYSCLRDTPLENPNQSFIAQLIKIKYARLLTLDEIGVRAYSTSIAALSAYPHRITSPLEITKLPGCDQKIATLWVEWHNSRSPASTPAASRDRSRRQSESLEHNEEQIQRDENLQQQRQRQQQQDQDTLLDAQRTIPIVNDLDNDLDLQILHQFHEIWGVGAETARKFYYQHGFRDLDDLVEFHWQSLTRVQQIGVKFYDEFQVKIPRAEVEKIAKVILRNARKAREIPEEYWSKRVVTIDDDDDDSGEHEDDSPSDDSNETSGSSSNNDDESSKNKKETKTKTRTRTKSIPVWPWEDPHGTHTHPRDFIGVIVGGHRRGKPTSGDVDIILSHRDESMTTNLIVDVVRALEEEGYITHTLTLHTTTSDRGGGTLPFRAQGHAGHGFDSLDKALCVWQDPDTTTTDTTSGEGEGEDKGNEKKNTNTNIHRRVDIIISPWKTLGCAILGWSGGTTFQRDVRRWVKRVKGWKFDSSGVRDRRNGEVLVGLEAPPTDHTSPSASPSASTSASASNAVVVGKDGWEDRERNLMEALGIGWREARFRCTG